MSILPDIEKNPADWYQEVVYQAELADQAPVRGSFVIRPYGYAIWENIKNVLDKRIKETGHENASFPLLIPESFLKREADHIEGFAPELAVVTYAGGKKLEEPLVVRPTSETIVHYMFAKWIKSWRDLPLKINQWANVIRWEKRPRVFLRTTEFFWQEGHTAHATLEEAEKEVDMMLREYVDFVRNYLAIPAVPGRKSESEKFPGSIKTMTFEALMQDGKALQMGTSHLLSQSFAKAFEMSYQNKRGELSYPYLTSWGVTTRLIGAVIMVHGDDKGIIIPPKIAPFQVVLIPIYRKEQEKKAVLAVVNSIVSKLKECGIRVKVDIDEGKRPGAKFYKWELKGVPLRIEIGPRDIEKKSVVLADRLGIGKRVVMLNVLADEVAFLLDQIQDVLLERAIQRRNSMWHKVAKLEEFGKKLANYNGFYQTGWCGSAACESQLKEYQASIRCLLNEKVFDSCFFCDKVSQTDVLTAKAY